MTIITDDLIEKGARAIFEMERTRHPTSPDFEWDDCSADHSAQARAALQAVLPDVVEKCARACDRPNPHLANLSHTRERAYEECAASIRSLLNKEDNANG